MSEDEHYEPWWLRGPLPTLPPVPPLPVPPSEEPGETEERPVPRKWVQPNLPWPSDPSEDAQTVREN